MKFSVTQQVFKRALEVGALAATADSANSDGDTVSLLTKSVHITADDALVFQSTNILLATKYSIENDKDKGVVVTTKGKILVPAKELLKWVNAQGKNSTITVELKMAKVPTTIDIQDDDGSEASKLSINKIGTVKIVSQDSAKTVGKWELDCYDPDQSIQTSFDDSQKGDHLFDIHAEKLTQALSKVSCASLDTDYTHIKDSVSIQNYQDSVYFATTDIKRCALYKGVNVDNVDSKKAVLISMKMLSLVGKVLDSEDRTSLHYDDVKNRVYLSQKNVHVRITCPDKDTIAKFPDIAKLLEKDYCSAGDIDKVPLAKMLMSATLVNKKSVLFSFEKDKSSLTLKATSENGTYKPNVSKSVMENVSKDAKAVWSAEHLLDMLKVIKTGKVSFMLPDNMKSAKILNEEDPNFVYFIMAINNHQYNNV